MRDVLGMPSHLMKFAFSIDKMNFQADCQHIDSSRAVQIAATAASAVAIPAGASTETLR